MLPIKAYVPVILEKTDSHKDYLNAHGVLVVYREEPTKEELDAYPKEELKELMYSPEGYAKGGYGKFGFRFYPVEKKGTEYIGEKNADFSWNTCYQMNFEHDGLVNEFELGWAVGIDFSCIPAILPPIELKHGLDEIFLNVLKQLRKELRAAWLKDSANGEMRELLDGISCEYFRRLVASGEELSGFEEMQWYELLRNDIPSHFGLYAAGDEVCFSTHRRPSIPDALSEESSIDANEWLKRGTICGCDRTDPRYVCGSIVDIYCPEEIMLYKEVPMHSIRGVFNRVDKPTYVSRIEESLERRWPPIEDSICEAQRKLFAATDGVVGHDDWPTPRYKRDQVVIFREHSQAPFQRGIIVSVPRSRGDWAPRGVYYDIECPQRLTTVIDLPGSNIYQVLGSVGNDVEEEPWMKRAHLCWNARFDGGSFDIYPASQSQVIEYWQNVVWDSWLDTFGHQLNIDDHDFHLFVRDLFESAFDNENPANAERIRQDGMGEQDWGFDWYGDNFYSLEDARAILHEVIARSLNDTEDFYSRFAMLFEAVINKAEELNAEPDSKGDFGVLVVGP